MPGTNEVEKNFNFEPVKNNPDKNGEVQMSPIEKVRAEVELAKVRKDLQAQELGFKDFEDFKVAKQKQELKEIELSKREESISVREGICDQREADCARAALLNENVKANLISHELQDFKKAEAVRRFAFQSYFSTLDLLFQKLLNAKKGADCYGRVLRNKRKVDESVAIDEIFLEELTPLIKSIQTVLKVSPKFTSEGEYLTQDEGVLDEDDISEESEEGTEATNN